MEDIYKGQPRHDQGETVPHVHKDGSRDHVLWWNTHGEHCSVKNCEKNASAPKPNDTD